MTTKKTDKKTSQKKIEANRRNAQRSTGQKTQRGKKISSGNSTDHGILSKEFINSSAMSEEEKKEFRKRLMDVFIYYKPVGPIEKDLLNRYVVNQFRLSRIIRAENGEHERSTEIVKGTFFGDNIAPYLDDGEKTQNKTYQSWEEVPAATLEHLGILAAKIAKDIETTGKVLSATLSELSRGLAVVNGTDNDQNENVRVINKAMKPPTLTPKNSKERWDSEVKRLEVCIDKDVRKPLVVMLKGIKDTFLENATVRMLEEMPAYRAQLLRASVPDSNRLMVLMRYETALENASYKALHELQRLQAFRMNRNATVPTAVDVTTTVSN